MLGKARNDDVFEKTLECRAEAEFGRVGGAENGVYFGDVVNEEGVEYHSCWF